MLVPMVATVAVAFGLGAQKLVKSVLAGMPILITRPFRIGNGIKVDSYYGEVVEIGVRTSRLRTLEKSTITLLNGTFLNQLVTNSNSGTLV